MGIKSHGIYDLSINPSFWIRVISSPISSAQLAQELQEFIGCSEVIPTDSGRSALFLALKALGCENGDVLVNAYTTDVVHKTIKAAGAVPVCFDIDPVSLRPDIASLEKKISAKTKAIIHTGLFGFPCGPADFIDEVRKLNIPVIEDICNSFGCAVEGRNSGTYGDFAIASFRVGKPLSSGGGALLINGEEQPCYPDQLIQDIGIFKDLTITARVLLDHMVLNPLFLRYIARPVRQITKKTALGKLLIRGGVVDTASLPSENSIMRMGSLQSTMAFSNLLLYEEVIRDRRNRGLLLRDSLSGMQLTLVGSDEYDQWNGLFFPVLMPDIGMSANLQVFLRRHGFDVSRFHYEVPSEILGKDYSKEYPGTHQLSERLVCLPCPDNAGTRNDLVRLLNHFLDTNGSQFSA